MPFTDISLDLETLDTSPRAVVTQIGAVPFNRYTGEIGVGIEQHVSIGSQPFRRMTWDTVWWWLNQSKEAKKQFTDGQLLYSKPLYRVLRNVFQHHLSHLVDWKTVRVWGNGAAFDNAVLEDVYKCTFRKKSAPWAFRNDMCLRTLLNEHEHEHKIRLKKTVLFIGERHSALSDARHQAKLVIEASK